MNSASSRCPARRRSWTVAASACMWLIFSRASDSVWAMSWSRLASAYLTMESAIFWAVSSVERMASSVER